MGAKRGHRDGQSGSNTYRPAKSALEIAYSATKEARAIWKLCRTDLRRIVDLLILTGQRANEIARLEMVGDRGWANRVPRDAPRTIAHIRFHSPPLHLRFSKLQTPRSNTHLFSAAAATSPLQTGFMQSVRSMLTLPNSTAHRYHNGLCTTFAEALRPA